MAICRHGQGTFFVHFVLLPSFQLDMLWLSLTVCLSSFGSKGGVSYLVEYAFGNVGIQGSVVVARGWLRPPRVLLV